MLKGLKVFLGLGISVVFILAGCNYSHIKSSSKEEDANTLTKIKVDEGNITNFKQKSVLDLLNSFDNISVITPDGKEIDLNQASLIKDLKMKLSRLQPSQGPISNFLYTLVSRSENSSPLVIQIGNEGIRMGGEYYSSNDIPNILHDIANGIAEQVLSDIEVNQLYLISLDSANRPIDFSEIETEELSKALKNSKFLSKTPDLKYPLFPYYVIQIIGEDKRVVNVDVIGKNIIAIPYGKGKSIYYKVEENLYDRFFALLPPFDYSEDNPKSLFHATGIEITHKEKTPVQFGGIGMESPQIDSLTDSFVRILLEGKKQEQYNNLGDIITILYFIIQDRKKKVEIYTDGYIFENHFYELLNINEKIAKQLDSILQ